MEETKQNNALPDSLRLASSSNGSINFSKFKFYKRLLIQSKSKCANQKTFWICDMMLSYSKSMLKN